MDGLDRLLPIAAAACTVVMTVVMLITFRKPRRLSLGSSLLNMILVSGTPLVYIILSGIGLHLALALPLCLSGLLVGFARGQSAEIVIQEGKTYLKTSLLALLGWGFSLVLVQALSMLQMSWLSSLGLLPVYFSTGINLGLQGNLFLRQLVQILWPKTFWSEDVVGIGGSTFSLLLLTAVLLLGSANTLDTLPHPTEPTDPALAVTATMESSILAIETADVIQPSATPTTEPRLIPHGGLVITLRAGWAFGMEGPNDLYLVEPSTWQVSKLNATPIYSSWLPTVSPDGIHLAYLSTQNGQRNVYIAHVDGSAARIVGEAGSPASNPFWSWNGEYLYYTIMDDQGWGLMRVSIDTLELEAIQHFMHDPTDLVLSPNGKQLLFTVNPSEFAEAHLLNLETGEDRLLEMGEAAFRFSWAPDGSKFSMLVENYGQGPNSARVYQADGSGERILEEGGQYGLSASWSPDSQRLTYLRINDFVEELVVASADGSGLGIISHPQGSFGDPVWSPDGSWLAFDAVRGIYDESGWDAFIVKPDGSDEQQLTQQLATEEMFIYQVIWVP